MFIVRTSSYYSFYLAQQPNAGQARLFATVSGSHTRTQPQSVGLLSTGERCDAEPCTCQHTTLTTCPRQDSNPQTQQAIGGRSSPQIARSLDFKNICFGKCLLLVCVCVCVCVLYVKILKIYFLPNFVFMCDIPSWYTDQDRNKIGQSQMYFAFILCNMFRL